jgi:serine/threonine-protein kinase
VILTPGTIVLEHRVVGHLGAGRVADVYEVEAPDGARRALKLLRPGLAGTSKAQERLAQEGEAVAIIEHVNVVAFHGGGMFEDRLAILVELVRGSDLDRRVREEGGKLPVAYAVRVVRQACEGVAAAHAKKILHRDLKPENILVTPEGLTKIADFGSAKLGNWGVQTTHEQEVSSSLHAAPERLTGKAGPKSDVFSMGIVLYEVIGGVHPFTPGPAPPIEIVRRLMEREAAPLSSVRPEVPSDLSDLVARALAKDPARRCTMRELADGLAAVLDRLDAPRRAVARNLLLREERVFARTEPMVTGRGAHGTEVMPAAAVDPLPEPRSATLPPAPVANRETLRAPAARPPKTLPMPEPPALLALVERRTTAAPVAREAVREGAPRSGLRWAVAAGVTAATAGIVGAGWVLVGQDAKPAGGTAAPEVSATVSAPAPAKAIPSASAARPPSRRPPRR